MKKLISLLIIAAMLVTLFAGCAKKPAEEPEEGGTTESGISDGAQETDSGEEGGGSQDGAAGSQSGGTQQSGGTSQSGGTQQSGGSKQSGGTQQGGGTSQSGGTQQSGGKSGSSYANEDTMQRGVSYGDFGQRIDANTKIDDGVAEGDATGGDDITPDEVKKFPSDGIVDERYNVNDGLPYVDSVDTSISDLKITADTYNETKLTLPAIRITTGNGKDITSRSTYVSATLSASGGGAAYNLKNVPIDVRGRGNSTWSEFEKKPYKIKFTVKTDLFGMGAAKKWVLLANALDETMMRNYIAFSLAKQLGLEFTNDFMFVNVFVNGGYKGVYLLTEQIQEGPTRVNINTSKTGVVDTGYLIEGINSKAKTDYKTFTVPAVNGRRPGDNYQHGENFQFIVEEPDELKCTDEQLAFISDYVTKANEAIFSKNWDNIQKYVDVNSFVNMFILDEVLMNQDMGYSFYMYKKAGGKLFMGPAWDFDQSAGCSSHGGSGYKGWYAGSEMAYFTALIEMDQFKQLVAKRYAEKKGAIHNMLTEIDSVINKNSYDFAMSNYVFNTFGSTTRWRTMYEIARLKTYKQHVVYLKTWLTNRMIWMEHQLGVK